MNKYLFLIVVVILLSACEDKGAKITPKLSAAQKEIRSTSIVILGNVQDAGSPQIACKKACCADLFKNPDPSRKVTALGLIDSKNDKTYLFEASPDMVSQMKILNQYEPNSDNEIVDGIFLTHAHIGHYTGLMYLGKEAMDAKNTSVYAMPRMKSFLTNSGPWSQLVKRNNISIQEIQANQTISLSNEIQITPILVPHRDEYSETVGYRIVGPQKSALFIPDIDKWNKWDRSIVEEVKKVDYAFLDATFYSGKEINNRDISQIPHPFVIESLETFKDLSANERSKIIFIHLNHTNPLLNPNSEESKLVIEKGFKIGRFSDVFEL